MKKLLLEIYLPAAQRAFDVLVPPNLTLGQIATLAAKSLSELSGGLYRTNGGGILFDRKSGAMLDIDMTAQRAGIGNGAKLMLI